MKLSPLRQRNFALLWWAGLISIAGDWMLSIALPIHVLRLTGSPLATAATVMARVLPSVLFGLIAGVYVDRWDRRRVMLIIIVLQGLCLLPLLAATSAGRIWIVFAVAFIQATLALFFTPAEASLLPQLVGAEELPAANSLNTLNDNIGRLVGPVLGGFGATFLGIQGVVLVDAATFAAASALLLLIAGTYRAARDSSEHHVWRELRDGLQAIRRSRVTTALMLVLLLISIGEGVMGSLFAVLVTGPLRGGSAALGSLMAAQAVGGIAGGLFGTRLSARVNPLTMATVALTTFGLIDIAIFNYPRWSQTLWPEIVLFIAVGVPAVLGQAALMTLLQTEHPGNILGRVFSVATVLSSVAVFAGASVAGPASIHFGVINVLTVQGTVQVLAAVMFATMVRGVKIAVHTPSEAVTRV